MNTNALVALDIIHALALALRQASTENRDVTDAELTAAAARLDETIARVQAKINALP